jgi:hypothetical protein
LPALALICAGLVAFTVFVIVPLGSANDRRAQSRTAADAAALAAADSAATSIRAIGTALLPGLGDAPGSAETLLTTLDGLEAAGQVVAADYANRNDSDLTDFRMTISLAGRRPVIETFAATQSRNRIETTDRYAHGQATSRIEVLGGLCGVGDAWGVELSDGSCQAIDDLSAPLPPPPHHPHPPHHPPAPDPPTALELRVSDPYLVR